MARNNVRLINYHTSGTTAPQIGDMAVGEIAVGKDLIWSKHKENEDLSVFISSGAVHSAISAAETTLKGITDGLSQKIEANTEKFKDYATSADTVAADTKTLTYAKSYTDLLKAKEGETYSGETLAGLKSEINSLKDGSDTTVGGLATRVTDIEGVLGKSDTEGLRKEVADLKTTVGDSTTGLVKDVADLKTKDTDLNNKIDAVSGASSDYTDSQINAIKGKSYETGTTLASLESKLGTEKGRIDAILKDAPNDLKSFNDVETKINASISSVYKVKGSCTYAELLKKSNQTEGDVWNVTDAHDNVPAGTNYVWAKGEGETTAKWDALGGTIDLSGYVSASSFNTLEQTVTGHTTDITNLKNLALTLNEGVNTIKGWKINDKFISGSPILNGTDIKVDATSGAKTLKEAIAEAASSGSDAKNAFITWTTETYTPNKQETDSKLGKIDAYTVNKIEISKNPVLTGENVLVGGTSEDKDKTLNATIAEAKAAGTTASEAITTLKGSYSGTLVTLSNKVDANEQKITQLRTDVNGISGKANSAIQKITIKENATAGVKISDPTGDDGAKTQELDFSAIVIDCGEF